MNELRQTIQTELDEKQTLLKMKTKSTISRRETIDVTLPSRQISIGSKHP